MKKRILGILITLVMLIGLVIAASITANAAIHIVGSVNPYVLSAGDIISETYITPDYGNSLTVYKATSVNDTTPDGEIIATLITSRDQKYLHEPYYVTYVSDTVLVLYPLKTCTITFNPNGGVGDTKTINGYQEVPLSKQAVSFETYTRTYYTFTGWNTAANGTGTTVTDDFVPTSSNNTVYAQWTPNTYTITFDAQGGTTTLNSLPVIYGSNQNNKLDTSLNPTKVGYTFDGWFDAPTGGNQVYKMSNGSCMKGAYWTNPWDVNGTGATWQYPNNVTLYAHWKPNTYTVNFNANGGEVATTSTSVIFDTTYGTLPTPTRTGYTFMGWYTDSVNGNKVESSTTVKITGTQTLYAHWEKIVYNVTLGENLHGNVNIPTANATMDDTVSVIITPDAGYEIDTLTFNGVAATKVSENNYTFTMPAADAVVDVTYKKIPYTVTLINDGTAAGGSFSVNMSTATIGDTVTITVDPNLGYLIESVTFNGFATTNNGDGTYSFTMPAQNVSVSVAFDVDLPAIAKELQLLNDADAALQSAIANGDSDLSDEIAALQNAITNAQNAINDLDNGYATDDQLDALKAELETAIANAKNEAITAANNALTTAKNELNAAIAQKADTATLNEKVEQLNTAIATAETLVKAYADNKDAALKAELETAIATAKSEAITAANDALTAAKNELNAAIAQKADTATLNEKVEQLNTAIATAETLAKAYADSKDAALKAELETAIATAKNEAITAANDALTTAKNELNAAIAEKADTATLNEKVAELTTAINNAETVAKAYADSKDAALKAELEAAIATAKSDLETMIGDVQSDLDTTKAKLDKAIDDLNKAITDGDKDLSDKIAALNTELTNAKAALEKADADNKAELVKKIEDADKALDDAVKTVQKNLDDAKAELEQAIADLDAAMKQGDADLSAEIAAVNTALTNAKAALEKADADNKAELIKKIEDADKILDEAIKTVQKNLDDAKAELDKAIADGDIALDGKITNLNTALNNAVAALKATDSVNKAALVAKIKATEATLDAAIKAVQKNLDDAKEELETAIADGDTELDGKITALSEALEAAKAALEAADSANKSELTTKIDEADAALQAAINALSNELNATNEKVAELETFIIIVCVISGVAFCGCGTLAVFYIIDKKKKI